MQMHFKSLGLMAAVIGAGVQGQALASPLGSADNFAVLGGSTVTSTGATVLTGELGVWPGVAITGFPPGVVIGGTIHLGDAVAQTAQADLTTAYNGFVAMVVTQVLTGQDLGARTLTPGVYFFSSSAGLTGTLTLDGQGNPASEWVFQIGSTLTTAAASSVVMINGGVGANVYWQVGSSATIGAATTLQGNILALASITMGAGATITDGRALARNGAVTLSANIITAGVPNTLPCPFDCEAAPDGQVGIRDFLAVLIQWGTVGSSCDVDGGGVGITDFNELLVAWGPCP